MANDVKDRCLESGVETHYGVANIEWGAPKIPSDPLTLGVLRTPAGVFEIASGTGGYAAI